ncbi:hypothetical protein DB29_00338 [Shouchella clausii]|nr:hypothetical protein DB29_00338 [Shouchella clausii]
MQPPRPYTIWTSENNMTATFAGIGESGSLRIAVDLKRATVL